MTSPSPTENIINIRNKSLYLGESPFLFLITTFFLQKKQICIVFINNFLGIQTSINLTQLNNKEE